MEDDTWSLGLSASSRSCQSPLKSLSDFCIDFDEAELDDDLMAEYPCPFCTDDFDLVELCSHIDDEHSSDEAQPGVCPVCAVTVEMNMVGHIRKRHGDIYKSLQKLKLCKGESHLTLPFLKEELKMSHIRLASESSSGVTSSKVAPDPWLSFLYNASSSNMPESVQPSCSAEFTLEEKSSDEKLLERNVQPSPLSDEEQREKAKRSEFVQGLLLSTIFDDNL